MKINYDLQVTEDSDAETFEHLLTVLMCMFDEDKFNEAKKYLKAYIKELFKQNIKK